MALEITNLRVVAAAQGGGAPGAESSILKIRGTEIRQAIDRPAAPRRWALRPAFPAGNIRFRLHDAEPVGPDYASVLAPQYFNRRKLSIYGGSNEIQKNIIAKMILGL